MTTDDDIPTFGGDAPETTPPARSASPLDALRAETEKRVSLPTVDLTVPVRAGWAMRYDPNKITSDSLQFWVKRASRKRKGGVTDGTDVDQIRVATMVLQAAHVAFLWQPQEDEAWQVVPNEDGRPQSVQDENWHDLLGVTTTAEALRAWYGSDGHILQAMEQVMDAAGFSEGDVNPLTAQ